MHAAQPEDAVQILLQMFPGLERPAIMATLLNCGGSLDAAVGRLLDAAPSTSSPQPEKRTTPRPERAHGRAAQPLGWSAFTARLQQQPGVSHASGGAALADPAAFPQLSSRPPQYSHDAKGHGGWQPAPAGPSGTQRAWERAGGLNQHSSSLQKLLLLHPWADQTLLEVSPHQHGLPAHCLGQHHVSEHP